MPDEWIEWKGGDCPVPAGTRVELKFRHGRTCKANSPQGWRWTDSSTEERGSEFDIVAYRVLPPPSEEEHPNATN